MKKKKKIFMILFLSICDAVSSGMAVGWIPETLWLPDYSLWKTSDFELGKMAFIMCLEINVTTGGAFIVCDEQPH